MTPTLLHAIGALVGGLLSGIWWPENPLAGGICGVVGAMTLRGLMCVVEHELGRKGVTA